MTADSSPDVRLDRALACLRGLSVGDALGSQYFVPVNYPLLKRREVPSGTWQWTDDTEMAGSVVAVLAAHHRIDQDALALSFAEHHDFDRGYGPAVNRLLRLVREGGDWRELAAALFKGQGSRC
jgi:ADP-ribosylglycohydrolase